MSDILPSWNCDSIDQKNPTTTIQLTPSILRDMISPILGQDSCFPRYTYLSNISYQVANILSVDIHNLPERVRLWIHRIFLENIWQIPYESFSCKFGEPVNIVIDPKKVEQLPEWRMEINRKLLLGESVIETIVD